MTSPRPRPRVLTVGAYERDNFGDLLFLLVTERYLPGSEIVPSAPFGADMTALLDRRVVGTWEALRTQDVDVLWTVGGQVGATSLESAYRMAAPPEEYARFAAAPPAVQAQLLSIASEGSRLVAPYLPTPAVLPRNAGAVVVLNSVGIAGMAGRAPRSRQELESALRTADLVSVRDRESSDYLRGLGVEHTLAPDVVHALGVLEPARPVIDSDVVVVQASTSILERVGHENLAERLAASRDLAGSRFRFVLAGTATRHDTLEGLERVAERLQQLAPGTPVEFATGRRPMEVVEAVRDSRIVIGTSLHVRIVAAAYGRPRVTLARRKPTDYARHWDPMMPFHVRLADLGEAVGAALAAGRDPRVLDASRELTRLADRNARHLAERALELAASRSPREREERAEFRRAALGAALAPAAVPAAESVLAELAAARAELERTRALLEEAQARGRGLGARLLRRPGALSGDAGRGGPGQ